VAVVMVLLPLLYVALTALIGYATYWHAVHNLSWFGGVRGSATRGVVFLYSAPIVVGGVLLFFMAKPLLARRKEPPSGLTLQPAAQPLLFAYVERLCALIGAPRPREIKVDCEVNASASFRRGAWSMLGSDLTLTIGLPLAAGLSLRQLTGILAHEFGHFAQGTGMRLMYVVYRINVWFHDVVYGRDRWDDFLDGCTRASEWWISLLAWLATFLVWLTRLVLKAFMYVGLAISSFLSRQMEFDADRFEIRVAGSQAMEDTFRDMRRLSMSSQAAHRQLMVAWAEKRLADNLPGLIRSHNERLPAAAVASMAKQMESTRTGWFDSHPSDRDRIASARREDAPGVVTLDAPASVLFHDFGALCRTLSFVYYRDTIGEEVQPRDLLPTDVFVEEAHRAGVEAQAAERLFGVAGNSARPMMLRDCQAPDSQDGKALVVALREAREATQRMAARAGDALEVFQRTEEPMFNVASADTLLRAGVRFRAAEFGLSGTSERDVQQKRAALAGERGRANDVLNELEASAGRRVAAAVALLGVPAASRHIANAPERRREAEEFVRLLALLRPYVVGLADLREKFQTLLVSGTALQADAENVVLESQFRTRLEGIFDTLSMARSELGSEPYPFEQAARRLTIGRYLCEKLPPKDDPNEILGAAQAYRGLLSELYERLTSRLAHITLTVEDALRQAAEARRDKRVAGSPTDAA
jgi:Zn-dependent protease with chaperone function